MALRPLLRKMPALGMRSLPIAPPMGPVRAISPAAPSRHLSQANLLCTTEQIDCSPEAMSRVLTEYNKSRVELHNSLAELDKIIGRIDQQIANLPETMRASSESIALRLNKCGNTFFAAHFGISALLVIGSMYKRSLNR